MQRGTSLTKRENSPRKITYTCSILVHVGIISKNNLATKITQTHIHIHVYTTDTKHERVVLLKAYQVVALSAFLVDRHHTRHKEIRETVLRNYNEGWNGRRQTSLSQNSQNFLFSHISLPIANAHIHNHAKTLCNVINVGAV